MKILFNIVLIVLSLLIIVLSIKLLAIKKEYANNQKMMELNQNSIMRISPLVEKTLFLSKEFKSNRYFPYDEILFLVPGDSNFFQMGKEFYTFYYGRSACLSCIDLIYSLIHENANMSKKLSNNLLILSSTESPSMLQQRRRLFKDLYFLANTNGDSYIDSLFVNDIGFFKVNAKGEMSNIVFYDDLPIINDIIKKDFIMKLFNK